MSARVGIDGLTADEREIYNRYAKRCREKGRTPIAKDHWLRLRNDPKHNPNASIRHKMQADKPVVEPTRDALWMQSEIERLKKEILAAKAIREQIFKLADATPTEPEWAINPHPSKGHANVPVLLCSDFHWGEVVDPAQIGGVNEFDLRIANRRLERLAERTIDLLRNHMNCPEPPGIVVCLGGDMVSGDIHEELRETNDCPTIPAVLDLFSGLVKLIHTFLGEFGHVFLPCVTGNHGRNTHKIRAKERVYTSYDWLLYQMLERHFKSLEEHGAIPKESVRFLTASGPDQPFRVYGHRYLLTHGDQFRGGDGMIGPIGPIVRGDHKKRSRAGQIGQEYDTLLLGHFHTWTPGRSRIINGSLVGYNEYANANNFGFEEPQQALWLTHPKRGITLHAAVHLEDPATELCTSWVSWPEGRREQA